MPSRQDNSASTASWPATISSPGVTRGHAPSSFAWPGAIGERTSKILLGTRVLTPTFRYTPAVVAQAFGTLACLFPETHDPRRRHRQCAQRGRRLSHRMAGVQGALGETTRVDQVDPPSVARGSGHVKGEHYRTTKATVHDRPDHKVPVYAAASGPLVAR